MLLGFHKRSVSLSYKPLHPPHSKKHFFIQANYLLKSWLERPKNKLWEAERKALGKSDQEPLVLGQVPYIMSRSYRVFLILHAMILSPPTSFLSVGERLSFRKLQASGKSF